MCRIAFPVLDRLFTCKSWEIFDDLILLLLFLFFGLNYFRGIEGLHEIILHSLISQTEFIAEFSQSVNDCRQAPGKSRNLNSSLVTGFLRSPPYRLVTSVFVLVCVRSSC